MAHATILFFRGRMINVGVFLVSVSGGAIRGEHLQVAHMLSIFQFPFGCDMLQPNPAFTQQLTTRYGQVHRGSTLEPYLGARPVDPHWCAACHTPPSGVTERHVCSVTYSFLSLLAEFAESPSLLCVIPRLKPILR